MSHQARGTDATNKCHPFPKTGSSEWLPRILSLPEWLPLKPQLIYDFWIRREDHNGREIGWSHSQVRKMGPGVVCYVTLPVPPLSMEWSEVFFLQSPFAL